MGKEASNFPGIYIFYKQDLNTTDFDLGLLFFPYSLSFLFYVSIIVIIFFFFIITFLFFIFTFSRLTLTVLKLHPVAPNMTH
jgi:hypothetical protein